VGGAGLPGVRATLDVRNAPMGGAKLPLGGTIEWPPASHYVVVNKGRLPQVFWN
jgi:hypothetical protein